MRKINTLSIALVILVAILITSSAYAVPNLINYQGKLKDSNGIALTGSYNLKFYLYTEQQGGSDLWNEQQTVKLTEGIYNVQLGAVEPFPDNLFDNDPLYLEVKIFSSATGWETLSPREQITSTAFAIKAEDADTVGGHGYMDFAAASHTHQGEDITSGIIDETYIDQAITRDSELIAHTEAPSAHHTKTTSFTELVDTAQDDQIPDDITVSYAKDADKVDGRHASEFGDGHSLDAADGNPVDAVYVDNSGNVGIGTTNPGQLLSLQNTLPVIEYIDNDHGNKKWFAGQTVGQFEVWEDSLTGSNSRFVIQQGGNVGIGTTSPTARLTVSNAISNEYGKSSIFLTSINSYFDFSAGLVFRGTGYIWSARFTSTDNMDPDGEILGIYKEETAPGVLGESIAVFKNNGNVGIGTTSPNEKLHIDGTTKIGALKFWGNTTGDFQSSGDLRPHIGTGNFVIYSGNVGSGIERFRVQSNGNVGIGTTSPNEKLHIAGAIKIGDLKFWGSATGDFQSSGDLRPHIGSGNFVIYSGNVGSGIERFRVQSNGNVGIGTTSPSYKLDVNGNIRCASLTQTSDIRLKKDIMQIDNPLEKVLSLRGVSFRWRPEESSEKDLPEGRKIGLIAQEVEEVLPEVVSTDNEGYKSVEYGNIVSVLIEAIKVQQTQINVQQTQIEELKARLEALER